MSIEWSSKVLKTFTVRDLLEASERILHSILNIKESPRLVVYDDPFEFARNGVGAEPLSERILDQKCEPLAGEARFFAIALMGRDDGVSICLSEAEYGEDDPESGTWCTVMASLVRTPVSYAIGIAVIVAASRLGGSAILDEACLLGARVMQAGETETRLRLPVSERSLDEAAEDLWKRLSRPT